MIEVTPGTLMQIQKETAPWVSEIIQPLIQGQPEPLTDTVPPQQLGDPDSQWIQVDGVNLHYKDIGPKTPGVPAVLLLHGFNGSVFSWYSPLVIAKHAVAPPLSRSTLERTLHLLLLTAT